MISLTYTNINSNFTLINICSYLEQFWIDKVKSLNHPKIWLTITVTSNKKSYIVINNLPFNISDYSDVVIVLRQAFESIPLDSSPCMDSITFEFITEKPKSKFIILGLLYIVLILLLLLICLIVFIIYLDIYPLLDNDFLSKEILDKSIDICSNITQDNTVNITNNRCSFLGTFLQYFSKSPSNYLHYPSYFLPSNINPIIYDFNLLEYILYKQYTILNIHSTLSKEYIEGLSSMLEQYQTITKRISS